MRRVAPEVAAMLPLAAAALLVAADPAPLKPGRHDLTLTAAGHEWAYSVQVPSAPGPLPLVLILHGAGGTGPLYLDKCSWSDQADAAGFVAVAPTGQPVRPQRPANGLTNPRIWNTDQVRPGVPRAQIDDLAFFDALLDDVSRRVKVDANRVYVVGHSNGAGMAFQLGALRSGRFAAVAAYAGYCWMAEPRPRHPRPTLFLVGDADPLTPLDGGGLRPPWGLTQPVPSVAESLARYAKGLGCPAEPKPVSDKDGVKTERYGPGRNGVTLTAVTIAGQGHGWPGSDGFVLPTLEARVLGPNVKTYDATAAVWEFFQQSRRE
jgi:polyhydroxybutyrate depolymerase